MNKLKKNNNKKGKFRRNTEMVLPLVKQLSQPFQVTDVDFNFNDTTTYTSSGGLYYYGNKFLRASLYQIRSGVSASIAGVTTWATLYSGYCITKAKFKVTYSNTLTAPLVVNQFPSGQSYTDDQISLQTGYRLPYNQQAVLGGYQSGQAVKTMTTLVDISKINGYDIMKSNTSFVTVWGNNPSITDGLQIVFFSQDGVTVPIVDVTINATITARMIVRKLLTS